MLGGIGKGVEKGGETFYFAWCGGDGWEEGGGVLFCLLWMW